MIKGTIKIEGIATFFVCERGTFPFGGAECQDGERVVAFIHNGEAVFYSRCKD